MAYIAVRKVRLEGKEYLPGEHLPKTEWKGNSLRAALNRGTIAIVPDEKISAGEGAVAPTPAVFQCQVCGKQNKSRRGLSIHAKTHAKG